jgi:LPS-assembly protein
MNFRRREHTLMKFRRAALASALCVLASTATIILIPTVSVQAQQAGGTFFSGGQADPNAQMLLEADQIIYDNDQNTVAALGNVQIAFDGYTLVAQRVTYSRLSGRVIATGDVEIVEPNGTRIFAQEIDITDDFSDGFVSALQVETADNTRFAAESAERRDGEISIFNNGVYTACEPCREDPQKPPLWQIRAKRVVINNRTQTVEYENASFEVKGEPVLYLPRFSHADPAIRRKSGFLIPSFTYTETLGFGTTGSYFLALAPNYDLTVSGSYFTNQGFLGQAEWRHRLENGEYNLKIAGINQDNPSDFDSNTIDSNETQRLALMSAGRFHINPRWTFGWNFLLQSDGNFAETYNLAGYNSRNITNEMYLTGLAGKNYFDLRGQKFLIQDSLYDQDKERAGVQKLQDQQGHALPVMDYNWVSDESVYGGQVSFDANLQNIHRHEWKVENFDNLLGQDVNERFHGIAGNSTRASLAAEWKRSEIFNGAVVTAALQGRVDGIMLDTDNLNSVSNPLTSNDSIWRGMAAGMVEMRYPLIARDGYATHLFEPIAQIVVRPDEQQIGQFPNEDAQSLVFDTTNLFRIDKFSGYDRVEGGTRANIGFRYSASFDNGASLNVAGGQSFHLAGQNSFEKRDLVNVGPDSGLETKHSDYVLSANVDNGAGLSVGVGGRFDEASLGLRRGEVQAHYLRTNFALAGSYVFVDNQPQYSYETRRHETNAAASIKLSEYWRAFASMSYDIEQANLYSRGIGIAYDDSCFSFSVAYNETESRYDGESTGASLLFRIGLRTIGDYGYDYTLEDVR